MDPLNEVRKLITAVEKAIGSAHLDLVEFAVVPSRGDRQDFAEIRLLITPEALMSVAEREQKSVDEVFAAMMSEFSEDHNLPKSEKVQDARLEIEQWLTEE